MRPKKRILLYCADRKLLSTILFALRLHPYKIVPFCDSMEASLVAADRDAAFLCGVLIHAQQGDPAGRLVHRLLESGLHIPLLLVDRAGDLAPVRYADIVLYGRNTSMAHILRCALPAQACTKAPESRVKYLSVCSGIEAVSVAWQPLGWQPAMFAEIDPFCCWLLRSRYRASRPVYMPSPHDAPTRKEAKQRAAAIRNVVALPADGDVINAGDFTRIGVNDVGAIDLLAGGTPCQSFSVAGKRAGLDDPRGNLTIEFARLADRFRPTWLVWENVPGVLSIDDGRTFGAFLGMLVECGYGIAYRILDARYFGVPQRRRRVFVVGHLGNWRAATAVFLQFTGLSGYLPPRREARQGSAGGVEVGPAGGRLTDTAPTIDSGCKDGFVRNQLGAGVLSSTDEISHCLNAVGMGRQDFETETLIAHALSADGFDTSEDGTGRGTPMVPVAICTAHTQSNGSGFSDDVAHTLESGGAQAIAFAQNSRDEVRLHGGDGRTVGALSAQPGAKQQSYVAFSMKDHGADAARHGTRPQPSQRRRRQVAVAFAQNQDGDLRSGEVMHSLGTNGNATSRNAPTVAFTLHGSEAAIRLRKQTFLLSEFLERFAVDYRPAGWNVKAIVHGHCHHKSLMKMADEESLLMKMGAKVTTLASGCCGMAKPFGFEKKKYNVSQAFAERVLIPAVRCSGPRDVIVTDGFSCREAVSQNSDRKALHLAEVLDLAQRGLGNSDFPEDATLTGLKKASRRRRFTLLTIAIGATAACIAASCFISRRRLPEIS